MDSRITSPQISASPEAQRAASRAESPFNKPNADVIIRTSDNVDFHVHRVILILASPFFADMFSLPQEPSTSTSGPPILDVQEPSVVWDALLRVCYPCADPASFLTSFSSIRTLIEVARKYQMPHVEEVAKSALKALCPSDVIKVFQWAVKDGLEEEARYAAQVWRKDVLRKGGFNSIHIGWDAARYLAADLDPYIDELSSATYFQFLRFAKTGLCDGLFCATSTKRQTQKLGATPSRFENPFRFSDADITLRSSDGVSFQVHKLMLEMASDRFAEMISQLDVEQGPGIDNFPLIVVDEDSYALGILLLLCYPTPEPTLPNLEHVFKVLDASIEHRMTRASNYAKQVWKTRLSMDPILSFFRAIMYKDELMIRLSAAHIVVDKVDMRNMRVHAHEMEAVPAVALYMLLNYRDRAEIWLRGWKKEQEWIAKERPRQRGYSGARMQETNEGMVNLLLQETDLWEDDFDTLMEL